MKQCCKEYLSIQFNGDDDIMAEIYGEYVNSVREKSAEASAALAAGRFDALDKIAHTIKGNALAAGDNETADVGIALRSAAKLGNGDEAAGLIARLGELVAAL